MAICPSCGKQYNIWNAALGEGVCISCSKAKKQASHAREEREAEFSARSLSENLRTIQ